MNPSKHVYNELNSHRPELTSRDNMHSLQPPRILDNPIGTTMDNPAPSFPYSHNIIPGLGLDFSSKNSDFRADQTLGTWIDLPQPLQAAGQGPRPGQTGDLNFPLTAKTSGEAANDVSEEGEISEGEIQDTTYNFEARNDLTVAPGTHARPNQANDTAILGGQAIRMVDEQPPAGATDLGTGWSASHHVPVNSARERSGSYSPHLSPREMNDSDLAHSITAHGNKCEAPDFIHIRYHDANETFLDPLGHQNQTATQTAPPNEMSYVFAAKAVSSSTSSLRSAKQQARDAIKHLVPLNIKYENFLEEGIDGAVLGPLFRDLGLGVHEDARVSQPDDVNMLDASVQPKSPDVSVFNAESLLSKPAVTESSKTADKSEERKDRIARLLAAKSSKSAKADSTRASDRSLTSAHVSSAQPFPKGQTDKSRLLQHKMEALRKSREKLAKARSKQQASKDSTVPGSELAEPSVADSIATTSKANEGASDSNDSSKQRPQSGKPSPAIPGLFLSSTPQPPIMSHSCHTFRGSPDPTNPGRPPFDQKAESRSFLINVSDEDDVEMDIDTPAQPLSTENVEKSSQKAASKELDSAMGKLSRHGMGSMSAVAPSRSSSHNSGGEDLASMNKKIEAMKRKIAEAEARKRRKLSRQVSPTGSQANESSRDGSMEAGSILQNSAAPSPLLARGRTPSNDQSTEMAAVTMPRIRAGRPDQLGQGEAANKRSRSRAASECLPLIEARRREKLEKLINLQSQIAKIEQEIADGMQEEVLKQDLDASESEEAAPQTVVSPSGHLPLCESPKDHTSPVSHSQHEVEQPGRIPSGTCYSSQASIQSSAIESAGHSSDMSAVTKGGNGDSREETSAFNMTEMTGNSVGSNGGGQDTDENITIDRPTSASQVPGMVDEAARIIAQPGSEHDDLESERNAVMKDSEPVTGQESDDMADEDEPLAADLSTSRNVSPALHAANLNEQEGPGRPCDAGKEELAALTTTPQHKSPLSQQETGTRTRGDDNSSLANSLPEYLTTSQALQKSQSAADECGRSCFVPYETPLQYFRAYRFHPEFGQTVAGGLRSLTYSNKIDVVNERPVAKGMGWITLDDQILLQLGAANNYQDDQRQKYISGLRQLLTEFRNRKVKDFNTISQGIIDYRAKFLGDRSKILPLGSVTI